MPDWFYRTVAQRALFSLPDHTARALALGVLGQLGRSAPGGALIEFLGHAQPDGRLALQVQGVEFCSPIGIGWRIDPERRATRALSRFGAGCIELSEVHAVSAKRAPNAELCDVTAPGELADADANGTPLLRRIVASDGRETVLLPSGAQLPVVGWDESVEVSAAHAAGVVLQVGARQGAGWRVPASMPAGLPARVCAWRARLPPGAALLVAGGVAEPQHAVALRNAGADIVLIDAGLVFRGPGLVKRCNEALLAARAGGERLPEHPGAVARHAWFWACALGAALALGGGAALALALSRVLLPYDEHYLGITADMLQRTSPRLFAFMAHDRATLAGTMLGLGWLYIVVGASAIRRGVHGAKTAVVASALVGFASFFAFFGFGYFDTLHAFVAAVLCQLTIQIIVGADGGATPPPFTIDDEDGAWRRAQWAQLLWLVHAAGLVIAGGVILTIGMTSVFVAEDLAFLCLTEREAQALGERTISVVAHDRATLGGMLLASGVGMLLPVLWCFRRRARWLWWAVAGLGMPAYTAAIGVHLWVGYTDWRHLAPAFAGMSLWLAGLVLGRGYLAPRSRQGAPER